MIYLCIALVIISSEYFAFMYWKESRKPTPQEPNKEILDRLANLEDQVSGLKIFSGLKRRE